MQEQTIESVEQEVSNEFVNIDEETSGDVAVEPEGLQTQESAKPEESESEQEVVVQIGEEPVQNDNEQRAPEWVRELRRNNRELQRKIRAYEQQYKSPEAAAQASLGQKPTIDQFEYDAEKFEAALSEWFEKKRIVDQQAEEARKEEENRQKAWDERRKSYEEAKTKLRVNDFEEVEEIVTENLSVTQQGIILSGADNPELIVYALGKNINKLKELSKETDPVKFAFKIARLEGKLKVVPRKPSVQPEQSVRNVAPTTNTESTLERLRAKAEKTGDYTEVIAFKAQMKKKQAAK